MLSSKGPPIGNGIWRIEWWSRDRLRHMTVTGQGHDPNIFGTQSRQRLEIHSDLVAMEHLQEMTSWESNGHVTP